MSSRHEPKDGAGDRAPVGPPDLTQICNASVALHRKHFGRGPGAAKAYAVDDLVVCLLTDVLTPAERTLVGAGEENRVLEWRAIHQAVVKEAFRGRMEAVLERPVRHYTSALEVGSGTVVDCYLLAPE
jgi:uncharacterized protein YbcI